MKPRTRTLGAIGATVVTAGLVLGLSFAGSSAATSTSHSTPTTVSMPVKQMPDMGSMMHQMMKGTVDDDVLAACDEAHTSMAGATTATRTGETNSMGMPIIATHCGADRHS